MLRLVDSRKNMVDNNCFKIGKSCLFYNLKLFIQRLWIYLCKELREMNKQFMITYDLTVNKENGSYSC